MKMSRRWNHDKPELCKSCSRLVYGASQILLRRYNIECKPDEVLRVWLSVNCAIVENGSPPAGYDDVIYAFRVDLSESGIRSAKPPRPEAWKKALEENDYVTRWWRRSK